MKTKTNRLQTFIAGTIIVASALFVLLFFLNSFLASSDNIKAAIMSGAVLIITAIYSHYKVRTRETESRLFSEKAAAYMKFYDLVFDMLFSLSKDQEVNFNSEEDLKKIIEIKKGIFVWGSSDTVKAWKEFEDNASETHVLQRVNKVFKCLRQDLGHNDKNIDDMFYIGFMLKAGEVDKIKANEDSIDIT